MTGSERIEIERACERIVSLYCHYVDHGEAERVAELFAKDGVWRSPESTMNGAEQIRHAFATRQANRGRVSRHVCDNCVIDVIDEDHAKGCVYLTLYRYDGDPDRAVAPLEGAELVGEYRDEFVRTPEGWRLSTREVAVSFMRRSG